MEVVSTEDVGSLLEMGTWYVADCEGDVPLCAFLPYIPGASLEERILAPAGLEDGDSGLVVAEQVEKLVCELWDRQLDGQCGVKSLEVAGGGLSWSSLGGKVA